MTDSKRTWRDFLSWFVASEFLLFAPLKLYPGPIGDWGSYPDRFARWGYPSWFSYVVGVTEIVAALLLLSRRTRFGAAVILCVVLEGAIVTHILAHDPLYQSVAAPVQLTLAIVIALSHWPSDWKATFSRSEGALP